MHSQCVGTPLALPATGRPTRTRAYAAGGITGRLDPLTAETVRRIYTLPDPEQAQAPLKLLIQLVNLRSGLRDAGVTANPLAAAIEANIDYVANDAYLAELYAGIRSGEYLADTGC